MSIYEEIENKIGYTFKDKSTLMIALTHSSYGQAAPDSMVQNNERLEFLGDAFFDAIISEELYGRIPHGEEGTLTKVRAMVVCEQSLARIGHSLDIGKYMFLGKGEAASGGRTRDSIVADATEALIGAVFIDGGYEASKKFVLAMFSGLIKEAMSGRLHVDYKSRLQEQVQKTAGKKLSYVLAGEEGPDHDKTFFIDLYLDDELVGKGTGKSKKEAEREAARDALEHGIR